MKESSKREMDALTARALLFQRKLSIKNIDWSIAGCEALDSQLAIIELGEDQIVGCADLAKKPDGTIDNAIAGAAAICKALVLRETKERILTDNDAQSVASWGHSVLGPLNNLVQEVSALTPDAIENAKKNSLKTQENGLDTSLQESSEEDVPSPN